MALAALAAGGSPRATAPESPLIRIAGLRKRYTVRRPWIDTLRRPLRAEQVDVLRGVSLEIREGEFFGLLGPNGAGKTTLFKVLATLVLPEAGSIEIAGVNALLDPGGVRRLLTPVIADERSLYWRLSGRQNLDLFAALYGVPPLERQRTADRLLGAVGLEHAASRMVGTYSSGMKQRLLIARALLSKPRVLLLDEPTRSLDPVSARDFRTFLREEIVGRQGCTVLLATHDADEAFELCDRLAVLDRGAVVAHGTVAELAGLAGENRYRLVVPARQASEVIRMSEASGAGPFREVRSSQPGWSHLEGPIPGGSPASALLAGRLVTGGVQVAELARVPLSLAGLIERLVAARTE